MSVDRPEEYRKNTQEQYAAVGRFVEAFEAMVHETRSGAHSLMLHGYIVKFSLALQITNLVGIPLYHQSLTAKPLFEIFRAVLMEKSSYPEYKAALKITDAQINIFRGALSAISREYEYLANKRNELLHGTWSIGYVSAEDPHAAKFQVDKYKTTGSGMSKLELPTIATELDALSKRCGETRIWLATVHGCVPPTKVNLQIEKCFKQIPKEKNAWERIWPSRHRFLPGHP